MDYALPKRGRRSNTASGQRKGSYAQEAWLQEFEIEFDEAKRAVTLEKRGLDFLDTPKIFAGSHMQLLDDRVDYGEPRYNSFGMLNDRNVVVTWTPRGNKRRIIAMRHYHEQELENRRRTLD